MTIAETLETIRLHAPDIDPERALRYLNQTWKELTAQTQFLNWAIDLSLEAGTRVYDLPDHVVRILAVDYIAAQAQVHRLRETSTDELDTQSQQVWRTVTTRGTPRQFYVQPINDFSNAKRVLGLLPTPDTSTPGGPPPPQPPGPEDYPKVRLFISTSVALEEEDQVPQSLLSEMPLVYGTLYRHAIEVRDFLTARTFRDLYETEREKSERYASGILARYNRQLLPSPLKGAGSRAI